GERSSIALAMGSVYVFHYMEAVVVAAVTLGYPRHEATDMVVDLFAGSVKLAATSGTHLNLE
ncbi:pyrroline-5-carboxylate reductase dimerization domain-containing protein, partial [Klebsiella aerogenes]|uniref:pyrroline-5-carboxylate reductase dimerization domain-containing protein n=1 Tax=Klebsiella aerogenes TaxID=548 RepID=UPI0019531DD1